MLGRLRLSIQEAINVYLKFAQQVFGHPRPLRWTKYSARKFEKVLQEVLATHCKCAENCGGKDEVMIQQDPHWDQHRSCMTTVVALKQQHSRSVEERWLFRSYDHLRRDHLEAGDWMNPGYTNTLNPEVKIWEVARATTAAPGYFHQMKIGNDPYMDGGVGSNNPSDLAWHNARQASRCSNPWIRVFLSVGTGRPQPNSHFGGNGNIPALVRHGIHRITDTEDVHKHIVNIVQNQGQRKTCYKRFNVDRGLQKVRMDEWKTKRLFPWRRKRRKENNQLITEYTNGTQLPSKSAHHRIEGTLKDGFEYTTLNKIDTATLKYLNQANQQNQQPVLENINELATKLVDVAYARRIADRTRWQHFTRITTETSSNTSS